MKREIALHFFSTLFLVVLIILAKRWFNLSYWPLLLGGVLGTFLPDIDHFIYVYFLKPQDLTSQRINYLVSKNSVPRTIELLYETRTERKNLIFHSFFFQVIFWILTFFVISSSGSVFGRGIVTAFSLHLIVDQFLDVKMLGNLDNWFSQTGILFPKERQNIYIVINAVLLGVVALIF